MDGGRVCPANLRLDDIKTCSEAVPCLGAGEGAVQEEPCHCESDPSRTERRLRIARVQALVRTFTVERSVPVVTQDGGALTVKARGDHWIL